MLEAEGRAIKKAELIMDWLLDQPSVEDVYLSDDEMVSLIRPVVMDPLQGTRDVSSSPSHKYGGFVEENSQQSPLFA